jgi:hypothetical protein
VTDTIRNIIVWTLALSAAYLVLSRSAQFNSVISNLTGNWAKLLVVSRGEAIPRI